METSNNLLDAEFKTFVIRMLRELRERLDELSENFNKKLIQQDPNNINPNRPTPNIS